MKLAYGTGHLEIDLGIKLTRILVPPAPASPASLENQVEKLLDSLSSRLRSSKPASISIVVEDRTRKNPEWPWLLGRLIAASAPVRPDRIHLVVAYGTHAAHSPQESERLYGRENLGRVILVEHDCRDASQLRQVGRLPSGRPLLLNRHLADADFVIALGNVSPHAFAGFTGGGKIVLPGTASYENIRCNHSKIGLGGVGLGRLEGNPLRAEMDAAAQLAGIDFGIQVVRDTNGRICGVFSGDLRQAFADAVALCRRLNTAAVDRCADVTLVSCGGAPYDDSLYQAQRALAVAVQATREHGVVIVFGKFPRGIGNSLFETWLAKPAKTILALKDSDIDVGVHSAFLMARNLNWCEVYWYSDLEHGLAEKLHLNRISCLRELERCISGQEGQPLTCYFIPNGSSLLIEKEQRP